MSYSKQSIKMVRKIVVLLALVSLAAALPADPVISKLDPEGLRYSYQRADDGTPHLVDSWIKASDVDAASRYNPDTDNEYHLYTRGNPLVSQPLVENNANILGASNFDASKRTVVLFHGFMGTTVSAFNTVLVPAFLLAGDVNVIVVDWGAGANWGLNGIQSGRAVGRVLRWIATTTGANLSNFHLIGYSVGAHSAAIAGRTLSGLAGYVTGLDPADRWLTSQQFNANDGLYTEVIHTSAGDIGAVQPMGHVDFYPNGGERQPGCATSLCNHYRSYFFMGEALATGRFIGTRCNSHLEAISQNCVSSDTLEMGGLLPKTGARGVYHLRTNASPPFALG